MGKTPKPVLYKTIFQLQYKVGLKFFDLLFPAAQRLTKFPNDWETDRFSVTLKDVERYCSLTIKHTSLTYEQDSNELDLEERYIQQALEELPTALEIDSCIRFGYRRQYLVETNMPFEALVSILDLKLLSQNEALRQIMPYIITDMMYRIDCIDDPYQYHLTIGPVKKEEIPTRISFNQENHLSSTKREAIYQEIVNKYPEVAILIDIDLYQLAEKLLIKDALPFSKFSQEKVHTMATDLSRYLLQKKLG